MTVVEPEVMPVRPGHTELWARRAAPTPSTAVREIFAAAARPGIISLAGGNPDVGSLPLEALGKTAAAIITGQGSRALQYGAGQGTEELRSQICTVMSLEGINDADPDDVSVTIGSQSGLDTVTKILCDPGDTVLTDDATYMGALGTFSVYEVDVQPVLTDSDGLVPEALRERIDTLRGLGKHIKFLYTIPNFNNPTGVTLSLERRQQVVDICREANILVVEDNPYGLLRYRGDALPAMRAANPLDVIYLSSFSKIFSPGLRLGWALVPPHLKQRFLIIGESSTLCPPAFNQMLTSAYLRDYDWQGQLEVSRAAYRLRSDAALSALSETMPDGVTWTRPEGGFFTWLTLPGAVDTQALITTAVDACVVYFPGAAFSLGTAPSNQLRLAFSALSPDLITEGIHRLAPVLARF
ncbi:aminotransferase [Pseudarthrobacter sulfonivorans]|uniref:Aminotransferase n=1 Tax=Pseudarthrobacter sulfonivorans TaxID=121292 RepID=A0A0U3FT58_9MICC|nr:PLP-dependent aminotransferase family protein [Pseudarthrobacter sulfonivorans]ALV42103.1 aminotransferase [Pseudarthrobacter sulfonivorans]